MKVEHIFTNGKGFVLEYTDGELRIDEYDKDIQWITIGHRHIPIKDGKFQAGPNKGEEYKPTKEQTKKGREVTKQLKGKINPSKIEDPKKSTQQRLKESSVKHIDPRIIDRLMKSYNEQEEYKESTPSEKHTKALNEAFNDWKASDDGSYRTGAGIYNATDVLKGLRNGVSIDTEDDTWTKSKGKWSNGTKTMSDRQMAEHLYKQDKKVTVNNPAKTVKRKQ